MIADRVLHAAALGARKALRTLWQLLAVMVPVTLAMSVLGWFGAIDLASRLAAPVMGLVGLPGEAALVLASSVFMNLFAVVGMAGSLTLSLRDMTILSVVCLLAHNLVAETAAMRKTGSSATKMVFLRLLFGAGLAFVLNFLLPEKMALAPWSSGAPSTRPSFSGMLVAWAMGASPLILKVAAMVLAVMVTQRIFEEFRVLPLLSKLLSPAMPFTGLRAGWAFLWTATNVMGYPHGAGLLKVEIEDGRMKPQDGDLFNHHAAMSHSLLEETAIFAVLGLSLFWLVIPRLALAIILVWIERVRRHYFRRSFRAGVA